MRTLFLTTAAFAALMIGAPIGKAHATVMSNCVEGDICPTVNPQDRALDLRLRPINPVIQFSNCLKQAAADVKYTMSFAGRAENSRDWIANASHKYEAAIHECYANRGF